MSMIQQIQIGLDIATAVSVLGATAHFIRNQKKESKNNREQRIAESGSKVIVENIHVLSASFNSLVKEYQDLDLTFSYFMLDEEKENAEWFYKRFDRNFLDENKQSSFSNEYEEFRRAFDSHVVILENARYSLVPVIAALEVNNENELVDEMNKLVVRMSELPEVLGNMHNKLVVLQSLWKELKDAYKKRSEIKDVSWERIVEEREDNQVYKAYDTQILSIALNGRYDDFLSDGFFSKEDFLSHLENKVEDETNYYRKYRVQRLYQILDDKEIVAALCCSIIVKVSNLVQDCVIESQRILYTLSAIYSCILNGKNSLDDEIKRYEKIFKLGKSLR